LTGIALLLGSWLFLFHLKGYHLGFCKKRFAATWAESICNV